MPYRIHTARWFYLFASLHLLAWTAIPALVRKNLPLDAIEGTVWGHQLQWGYDKNPFLNGWLSALAIYLDHHSGWMLYLFSQIAVVICFWVVWQLGKKLLSPTYALVAVLMLEGIQYFNFHAIDFNDNTLELCLWALTVYFFYDALKTNQTKHWVLTGLFAGLGMMAKYYTLALLAALGLLLICNPTYHKTFRTKGFYGGFLTCLIIILPHIVWLFSHEFITIQYVFDRTSASPSWMNHFNFPIQFTWEQLQAFFPALLFCALLLIGKRPFFEPNRMVLNSNDKQFLYCVALGPFLLTILLSLFSGIKLRAGWGMPLQSFWSLLLLASVQPRLSGMKLYQFIVLTFILTGLLLTAYVYSLIDSKDPSSANFPGREVAQFITKKWHDQYHTPLVYVAGSRWIGGNIGFYSPDHPAVFFQWDPRRSPWINSADLRQKGGVFVWNISANASLPKKVKAAFPTVSFPEVLEFSWKRNKNHLAPIKIGIAFLPPSNHLVEKEAVL